LRRRSDIPNGGFLFLRNLRKRHRTQTTLLIPGHAHQIKNSSSEPIPYAVLGSTRHARPVIHRDFLRSRAAAMNENGQKPMPAVEGEDTVESRALEYTQRTAGILKVHAAPVGSPLTNTPKNAFTFFTEYRLAARFEIGGVAEPGKTSERLS